MGCLPSQDRDSRFDKVMWFDKNGWGKQGKDNWRLEGAGAEKGAQAASLPLPPAGRKSLLD